MNILFVSDVYLPTVSGVASSTDSIVRYMAQQGHHVTLVCPRPLDKYEPVPLPGLEYVYTPGISDPLFVNKSMTVFPLGFPVLWKIIRHHPIDIMHIQEPGSLGITALILAKMFRLPVVGAQHFSWLQAKRIAPRIIRWITIPLLQRYVRLVYRAFDAIMVPTPTAAKSLSEVMGYTQGIYPISNGVDTNVYVPRKGTYDLLRKKYTVAQDKPVFLYMGRLDADKNIETILHAFAFVHTPIQLIIGGVGKQKSTLQKLAKGLNTHNSIIWMELNRNSIIDMYHLADVFVIMSPVETQSIVTLQALSCGLPIIAANAGALPELVYKNNGYLVDTYDSSSLALVMENMATHPQIFHTMGRESRKISLLHHKPTVLKKLEMLYDHVIKHTHDNHSC